MTSASAVDSRDLDSLRRAVSRGARTKYVFFWGHRPPRDGLISAACFSQWYAAPFSAGGAAYPTAERYMMAEKARLFRDLDAAERVLAAGSPGAAKSIGREVRGFIEAEWALHRFAVAVAGNLAKFRQHPELGAFLAGTNKRVLAEASPVDRIWGIGLESDDPRASDPSEWQGLNLLGFALMEVRARLAAGR